MKNKLSRVIILWFIYRNKIMDNTVIDEKIIQVPTIVGIMGQSQENLKLIINNIKEEIFSEPNNRNSYVHGIISLTTTLNEGNKLSPNNEHAVNKFKLTQAAINIICSQFYNSTTFRVDLFKDALKAFCNFIELRDYVDTKVLLDGIDRFFKITEQ